MTHPTQNIKRFKAPARIGSCSRFWGLLFIFLLAPLFLGCAYYNTSSSSATFSKPGTVAQLMLPEMFGPTNVQPGGQVNQRITLVNIYSGKRQVLWTPPPGAANFEFPGIKPNPGGPPFLFEDVDGSEDILTNYTAPAGEGVLVDTVQIAYQDISFKTITRETNSEFPLTGSAAAAVPRFEAAPSHSPTLSQATVKVWEVQTWFDAKGDTLTTDLCQDLVAKLQSDSFFLAARTPVTATASITGSSPLPFVFGSPYSQTLYLDDYSDPWGSPMIFTTTLEYRPERHTFLANALPSAAGERWAALGGASVEPAACPQGLNVSAGDWGLRSDLWLDLSDQPNVCEGCEVNLYYCYEGQTPPSFSALARPLAVPAYQGEGITCIGPQITTLVDESAAPPLQMQGGGYHPVTPPATVSSHRILLTAGQVNVNLVYSSTLAVAWNMYEDNGSGGPDLSKPITPPILVNSFQEIWLVADIPNGATAGLQTLNVTASLVDDPTSTVTTSDILWIGDWVAPPTSQQFVYLPLVIK